MVKIWLLMDSEDSKEPDKTLHRKNLNKKNLNENAWPGNPFRVFQQGKNHGTFFKVLLNIFK